MRLSCLLRSRSFTRQEDYCELSGSSFRTSNFTSEALFWIAMLDNISRKKQKQRGQLSSSILSNENIPLFKYTSNQGCLIFFLEINALLMKYQK